jgi:hypothetical protein
MGRPKKKYKLSQQALVTLALGFQKAFVLDADFGDTLKQLEFICDDDELFIENYDVARMTLEEFENKYGEMEEENNRQMELPLLPKQDNEDLN